LNEMMSGSKGHSIYFHRQFAQNRFDCATCSMMETRLIKSWKPLLNTILCSEARRNASWKGAQKKYFVQIAMIYL